jgi:hypothetical protein
MLLFMKFRDISQGIIPYEALVGASESESGNGDKQERLFAFKFIFAIISASWKFFLISLINL